MSTGPSTAIATAAANIRALWTGASGWLTTGQVARRLGYTRQRVWQLIEAGEIPAQRLHRGAKWRIPLEWVREQLLPIVRRKPDDTHTIDAASIADPTTQQTNQDTPKSPRSDEEPTSPDGDTTES